MYNEHKNQLQAPKTKSARKGLIDAKKIKKITFTVVVLCLIVSTFSCIMAIWDFTNDDALWRTIATSITVSLSMVIFNAINLAYGEKTTN